jgi:quercetin dioxygenase-like cupin family protein
MKRLPALLVAASALAMALPASSFAEPSQTATVLERRIQAAEPPLFAEVYQSVLEFEPGAWTVLHSHNGYSYNTVLEGEVTLRRDGIDQTFAVGQGWIDRPDVLHLAGNQSAGRGRLQVSFVVQRGVPPTKIVEADPQVEIPPQPDIIAAVKLNTTSLPSSLDVVHLMMTLAPGASLPEPIEGSQRLVNVLDGSVTLHEDGELQVYADGDGWADDANSTLDPVAGESGAQVVMTTFVARGAASEAPTAQSASEAVSLATR